MKKVNIKIICSLVVFVAFLCLLPSVGLAQDCNATVVGYPTIHPSINAAINSLGNNASWKTINVTGTCNENIGINVDKNAITLDGGGTATINAYYPEMGTIRISGKQIVIRGFTITGGLDGIQVLQGATATIGTSRSAPILTLPPYVCPPWAPSGCIPVPPEYLPPTYKNKIHSNHRSGIVLSGGSYAVIVNNEIFENGLDPVLPVDFPVKGGILVSDNSTAYIGYTGPGDSIASPNTIWNNPYGVAVSNSSEGRIVGNKIYNNTIDGIYVTRVSIAIIAENDIYSNGQNGISVSQNSGVNLGINTGSATFDHSNISTAPNLGKGLKCSIGGYADGILGTLAGAGKRDATDFTRDCINNLIP